jgi:acetylornithine deacetylase
MNVIDTHANFDAQLATTKDFVAIPSTRGHDFSKARTVVGSYRRSSNAGKLLILQEH